MVAYRSPLQVGQLEIVELLTTFDASALSWTEGTGDDAGKFSATLADFATPGGILALRVERVALTGGENFDADALAVRDADGDAVGSIDLTDGDATLDVYSADVVGSGAAAVESLTQLAADVRAGEPLSFAGIVNGSTAGKLQNGSAAEYRGPTGVVSSVAATDDLWDLTGEAAPAAGKIVAIALCLNDSGTATIVRGDEVDGARDAAGFVAAVNALTRPTDRTVIGYFFADENTNFAAGLTSSGTVVHGQLYQAYTAPAVNPAAVNDLVVVAEGGATDNEPTGGSITVRVLGVELAD
jgi:hypothetical protein